MSSHIDSLVNDDFYEWLNAKYGEHGDVTQTRGKIHDYQGMDFDFTKPGELTVDMTKYMKKMLDEYEGEIKENDTAPTPLAMDGFDVDESEELNEKMKENFHTIVAKGLYACKRGRPDIHTAIAHLTTRVQCPNKSDLKKLERLLKYINGTKSYKLRLSADDLRVIKWYVDASFGVHPDFKSHTGGTMTYGRGAPITVSKKQKLNTRSSTESELVGADDVTIMILWTKLFLEEQGYEISRNILYQDNKSAILLEKNGKQSSSQRTRAINIRYFYITDQAARGMLEIKYCPTKKMMGDYMTKPLQGRLFNKFRDEIMGEQLVSQ